MIKRYDYFAEGFIMTITKDMSYKIQLLRGCSIIAVVLIHNTPSGQAQIWVRPFINFAVGLFLFLSGMLSSNDKWNPQKRILKVLFPYVIWSLVYVIMCYYKTPSQIPIRLLDNLVSGNAAAIMYYVFVYCEFSLLIPLVDKLAKSRLKYLGFIVAPTEIIIMRLIPIITGCDLSKYVYVGFIRHISCLGWFTYFYLGYLIGNDLLKVKISKYKLLMVLMGSIALQMLEGYWYYVLGESNCGTQLKISALITGSVFVVLSFLFIVSKRKYNLKPLYIIGNYSFGIYFSHLAIMEVINRIPHYSEYVPFPVNAIIVVFLSLLFSFVGRRILKKFAKYLAL